MAVNPEKVYEGRPCRSCGNTLRWKCDRHCVACHRRRNAQREVARRRRLQERGLCTRCGHKPLLSAAQCWDCLNKQEEYGLLRIR